MEQHPDTVKVIGSNPVLSTNIARRSGDPKSLISFFEVGSTPTLATNDDNVPERPPRLGGKRDIVGL